MEYILKNGLKLIYRKRQSQMTSICIGIEAGAASEKENELKGVAHAVEHMIYKGTNTKTESEINEKLSNIFAFQNAMTNYPYAIFYGSLLQDDLDKGLELFSDIIINPKFSKDGFKEEMDVIKQELKEWDQELKQYVEDKLFFNEFSRRLKYPIIGTKDSLDKITLTDLKKFYNNNYFPGNTVISIVTDLDFKFVSEIVQMYFGNWKVNKLKIFDEYIEKLREKEYTDYKYGISIAAVEIIFSLKELSVDEIRALMVFDEFFAKGVDSVLFDNLRTKRGLVYDVLSYMSYEKYIKLYKITFNTSKEKVQEAVLCIKDIVTNINEYMAKLNNRKISEISKKLKLKKIFQEEKSIMLAKNLTIHDIMFDIDNAYEYITADFSNIKCEDIYHVVNKILKNITVEKVISNQEV